jgi:glycosyltransferase involved in cell wall biosynthesis
MSLPPERPANRVETYSPARRFAEIPELDRLVERLWSRPGLERLDSPAPVRSPQTTPIEPPPPHDGRRRLVLGVSTFNRVEYLQRFVSSFESTRSADFSWTLVVADDGSTDGTIDYLETIKPQGYRLIVIRNHGARIAGQSNSVFEAARGIGFDFGFKADDDVFFKQAGWDHLYLQAATDGGVDHLVYHNEGWKPRSHDIVDGRLRSSVNALDSMGCFYTFTPAMLEAVGLMDEPAFPVRGHAHLDYTLRACRAGFNDRETLWDADGSEELVGMWSREEYIDLTDWSSPEIKAVLSPDERARRQSILDDETRIGMRPGRGNPASGRSAVQVTPSRGSDIARLIATGRFWAPRSINAMFDAVFVLNLAGDTRKWATTASMLASEGVAFERFPGAAGNAEELAAEWSEYASEGLTLPIEIEINRKLIQSPGAWGYLKTMEQLLEHAKERRLRRILVFDDDVRLRVDFASMFDKVERELPRDWKLLYLGCTQTNWTATRWRSDHLYHPHADVDGSFAVGIDSSLFDEILGRVRRYDWPFDAGPLRSVMADHPDASLAVHPNLVIPDVSHSAIRDSRDIATMADRARWDLQAYVQRDAPFPRRLRPADTVSVLLPARDEEDALLDTLESLRFQTHGEIEVLVLVNGAAPRSMAVAEAASRRDQRVRIFSTETEIEDSPALLEALIAHATGDLLSITMPGEVSSARRYEHAVRTLREHGDAGAVSANRITSTWQMTGRSNTETDIESWLTLPDAHVDQHVDVIRRSMLESTGRVLDTGPRALGEILQRGRAAGFARAADVHAVTSVGPEIDEGPAHWRQFHDQVTEGTRSAYVPPIERHPVLRTHRSLV